MKKRPSLARREVAAVNRCLFWSKAAHGFALLQSSPTTAAGLSNDLHFVCLRASNRAHHSAEEHALAAVRFSEWSMRRDCL